MGRVGRIIAGVALIAGGVVIGIATGNVGLGFAVASIGVGLLTRPPEVDMSDRQGAILENRVGAEEPIPVVYGSTQVAGVITDMRVDPASTERKRFVLVISFCHGSRDGGNITGIDSVSFDDREAIFGALILPPFDRIAPGSSVKDLEYQYHLGSATQVVDAKLNQYFPIQWPTTSKLDGVAYGRFELWFDPDTYPSGLPTVTAKIRGNRVYDPRDGTWKHSTNPALCIRDYLLSPIYGFGVAEEYLDDQSFIDEANYCDEMVDTPDSSGGLQKRFELNGWVDTSQGIDQNLLQLCSACRAQVFNEGDMWRILIRKQRPVSGFKLTEENVLEGSWSFVLPGSAAAPNIIRATYVDPAQKYAADMVQWPEPGEVNAYLAEDFDYEQRVEMSLPFTDNRVRAQQIAMTLLKEARQGISATVTLKDQALTTRSGDLVEVTHSTPGWTDKVFDVFAMVVQRDGSIQAILVEYDPTVYDLDTQFPQPAAQDTNLPNPFEVAAPTSLVLASIDQELLMNDGGYVPRIRATWAKANDPFVDYYEIQAKKATDSLWDTFGRADGAGDALFFVYPVTLESWNVRIRAVNHVGVHSDWVSNTHTVQSQDPRPQIISITLTNAHIDSSHTDVHSDVSHGDAAHGDSHTDTSHIDHSDHGDTHSDSAGHGDVAHVDSHGDDGVIDTGHTDTHDDSPHDDHGDGHSDSHTDTDHQDTPHDDSHGDVGAVDTDHTDVHADNAHTDHTDSALGHSDTAHVDSHTDAAHADAAHSDGHVDVAHSDGQHGIGVAIQADQDSASVKAVARKVSTNKVVNGGGETGTVGVQATSWTFSSGQDLKVADDFWKGGSKSLKIINSSAADSKSYQDVVLEAGKRYRLEGWIKTDALPSADAGFGAVLNAEIQSGITSWTIEEKSTVGTDPSASQPDIGIEADDAAHDFTYVFCRFIPLAAGTLRLYCQLGYAGNQSGTAWFDEVSVTLDEPSTVDVRAGQPVDGRNVVLELIDAATGEQISMDPGDMVRVGALGYSEANGGGVEGPIALASVGLFTVASVGTDKWVPS